MKPLNATIEFQSDDGVVEVRVTEQEDGITDPQEALELLATRASKYAPR